MIEHKTLAFIAFLLYEGNPLGSAAPFEVVDVALEVKL